MTEIEKVIRERLFELQDLKYREFECKLLPNISPDTVIGVRTPEFRKLAKELSKRPDISEFLTALPHKYYEENNLHSFLIQTFKDYNETAEALEKFLPYVNNWGVCDSIKPRVFKNHLSQLLLKIKKWIKSPHEYTVRFAVGALMTFYLDNDFKPEYLEMVSNIKSEKYYVRMMIAWYFATALAKQYESAVVYIQNKKLSPWIHNKSIQKAVESKRISNEKKEYLKSLKIKPAPKF